MLNRRNRSAPQQVFTISLYTRARISIRIFITARGEFIGKCVELARAVHSAAHNKRNNNGKDWQVILVYQFLFCFVV